MNADPWDWSVWDVIKYLCGAQGPLFPYFGNNIDKADIETAVSNNLLTGEYLLKLSDTQIEKCLGIHAAAHQIRCREGIRRLQLQSVKWLSHTSQHGTPQQACLMSSLDTATPSDSVFTSGTQTQYGQSHETVAQPISQAVSKRITPTLFTHQTGLGSSDKEAKLTNDQNDGKNAMTVAGCGRFLIRNSKHNQDYSPNLGDLIVGVDLPQIPEEAFSRNMSQTIGGKMLESTQQNIDKKGENPILENGHESESLRSNPSGYKILKEIKDAQLNRWQVSKLPLLKMKAHQLWTNAKDRQLEQNRCLETIAMLKERLRKFESGILSSTSDRDLERMAEALQPTVTDIATWQWKLDVYRQDRQPAIAQNQALKKHQKRKSLHSDDETDLPSEDSDDETDLSSEDSDDSIYNDKEDAYGDTDWDEFIDKDEEDEDRVEMGVEHGDIPPMYRIEREPTTGKEILVVED